MNGLRRRFAYLMRQLGAGGIVGIGLAVYAAMYYASAIVPAQAKVEQLQQRVAASEARAAKLAREGGAAAQGPEARLASFYASFPTRDSVSAWLEKLYGVASTQTLSLENGEYRFLAATSGKLGRYEIVLPVKGEYVQIRKFIAEVLREIPVAALEDVRFKRENISSETIEAKIRLVLYLRAE